MSPPSPTSAEHPEPLSSASSGDRELVIIRTFAAPRALVWRAWTEAERMVQWMAPSGFTIPFSEGELRPGGAWRAHMRAPDGSLHRGGGVYREVVPPERLVFTHAWTGADGTRSPETLVTVVLAESGGKTVMTFRQSGFPSVESRDGHGEGWKQCFERLEGVLERES